MAKNDRNPANPESELFVRLTRLFSGPLTNYKSQTPRRLRRHQLDQFNTRFRSASGQQFKRSSYYPFTNMQNALMINHNRTERYVDFDQMEYTPEIASALDIYADEMTTHSALQPMLSIKCPSEEIRSTLFSLYHNVLNINSNLFGWCRTMCKFGDFFLYLDTDEAKGIVNGIGLPSNEVERLEGEDKTNPNYVQFQWNSAGMTFENWQVAHFRILGNDKYSPYGTSVLEPARRIWRQLNLLEDAMMAYRIVRAPDRRVFYVDVGSIAPTEIEQYMQRVMTQMKRNSIVDENTGRVDLRYNPLSVEEDYYIPVRGTTSSKIESLPGGSFTGQIDDVKYLRDKLFSALKIPASYLAQGDGQTEDKTTLAQKDIRFARTIQRLQRAVVAELEKIGIIHLYTLGFRGDDLLSFSLSLNNPSKIAELQELEHWSTKFDVAAKATENFFSRRWIAERLFNMTEEEFLRNQREIFYDRKFDAQIAGVAERMQESSAASPFGENPESPLGALGGGELGGGELGGGEGETPELGGGAEAGAEAPAEEPGALLAAPGGGTETPAGGEEGGAEIEPGAITLQEDDVDEVEVVRVTSKGVEKRHRGPSGKTYYEAERPRNTANVRTQKEIATMVKPEAVSYRTQRSRNPTKPQFTQLVKGSGLEETIYNQQEAEILRSQIEVKKLLESLEKKTK